MLYLIKITRLPVNMFKWYFISIRYMANICNDDIWFDSILMGSVNYNNISAICYIRKKWFLYLLTHLYQYLQIYSSCACFVWIQINSEAAAVISLFTCTNLSIDLFMFYLTSWSIIIIQYMWFLNNMK